MQPNVYGDTPYVKHEAETDYKRLFYSRPEQALMKDITLSPGFGILRAGTILARNLSAAGNLNKYVPYNPTVPNNASEWQKGRAFLVQDASGSTFYVTLGDSYKFVVGDDACIGDGNSTAENLGAITAIDRTTYAHMAIITTTSGISGTFTVAQSAFLCVEAGVVGNLFSLAVGVLLASVDTGKGENAKGALAPMLLKNAILYYGLLTNIDAAAVTALGGSQDGRFLIV